MYVLYGGSSIIACCEVGNFKFIYILVKAALCHSL